MSVEGKSIVVSGASRNIGFHAARFLANAGAKVALVGRSRETIEDAAAQIGKGAVAIVGDSSNADDVDRIISEAAEILGGIDGLINNAGIAYPNRIEKLDLAQVQEQIATNLFAPIWMCRAVIPHLRARGGGRIVNVSSATVHQMDAFAHLSIYGATKAGLERFTKDLNHELRADNIGVTTFIPGDTATGFGMGWDPEIAGEAYAAWLEMGPYCAGMMAVEYVGEQLAHCMMLPDSCAFDFVLMRPVGRRPKLMEADAEPPKT